MAAWSSILKDLDALELGGEVSWQSPDDTSKAGEMPFRHFFELAAVVEATRDTYYIDMYWICMFTVHVYIYICTWYRYIINLLCLGLWAKGMVVCSYLFIKTPLPRHKTSLSTSSGILGPWWVPFHWMDSWWDVFDVFPVRHLDSSPLGDHHLACCETKAVNIWSSDHLTMLSSYLLCKS